MSGINERFWLVIEHKTAMPVVVAIVRDCRDRAVMAAKEHASKHPGVPVYVAAVTGKAVANDTTWTEHTTWTELQGRSAYTYAARRRCTDSPG